jgi:hypothetical protein
MEPRVTFLTFSGWFQKIFYVWTIWHFFYKVQSLCKRKLVCNRAHFCRWICWARTMSVKQWRRELCVTKIKGKFESSMKKNCSRTISWALFQMKLFVLKFIFQLGSLIFLQFFFSWTECEASIDSIEWKTYWDQRKGYLRAEIRYLRENNSIFELFF